MGGSDEGMGGVDGGWVKQTRDGVGQTGGWVRPTRDGLGGQELGEVDKRRVGQTGDGWGR